jgi:hypothetical protein
MLRWTLGLVVAATLTGFALLLLHGEYSHEGRVVLVLSNARGWGIHRGDILIVGGWLVSVVALVTLVVDRPRRRPATRATDSGLSQPMP